MTDLEAELPGATHDEAGGLIIDELSGHSAAGPRI